MEYFLAYIYNHENSFYELVKAENIDKARDKVSIKYGYEYDIEVTEPL